MSRLPRVVSAFFKQRFTSGRIIVLLLLSALPLAYVLTAQTASSVSLGTARWGHTATAIGNGRVFVAGGANPNGLVAATEIVDLAGSQATAGPNLLTPRTGHTATVLPDGEVLIAGGSGAGGPLASTELFDPTTGSLVAGPSLTFARAGHTATVLADGSVLFVGGNAAGSAEVYQPSTGAFTAVGGLNDARAAHAAAVMPDGIVMIAGGTGNDGTPLTSVELFDPGTGQFTSVPGGMQAARVRPVLHVLPDSKVQIVGGDSAFTFEMFDYLRWDFKAMAAVPPIASLLSPTLASPTRRALLTTSVGQNPNVTPDLYGALGRDDFATAGVGAHAVVVGGIDAGGQALGSIAEFPASAASITTQWIDYSPGSTVTITGQGWTPGETVTIVVHQEPQIRPDTTVASVADSSGSITNSDFSTLSTDYGSVFSMTATGSMSGYAAQTAIKDGNPTIQFATSSLQAGISVTVNWGPTPGFGSQVTFAAPGPAPSTPINVSNGEHIFYSFPFIKNQGTWYGPFSYSVPSGFSANGNQAVTITATYHAVTNSGLTVSAATGTYGGTTTLSATLTAGSTPISGRAVAFTLNGTSLGNATTNGSGVATLSNVSLAGIGAGTYGQGVSASFAGDTTYAPSSGTNSLTVSPKALTVTGITASNKVYDGTTTATLNTSAAALVGVLSGDTVTVNTSSATGVFADKNVGTGKTVTVSGLTLGGSSAANYTVTQPTATANITAKPLTVSGVTAANKVYDGTTTATLNTTSAALVGLVSGDSVTLSANGATGAFSDKTVGNGKTVTVSGLTISGADAGNYSLTQPTTTANITPKTLTVSGVTAANKTYDGATTATLNTTSAALVGIVTGDTVTLSTSGAAGAFADKNVGTGKTVSVSGLTIGGTDAGNYSLTQPTTTANITPKTLTVIGVTAASKVYDGTTTATLGTGTAALVGVVSGDSVTLLTSGAAGAFSDKNAGNGKTVTVGGLALSGTDAGNYSLTQPTATANITPRTLTVTGVTAANKTYDGTTTATVNTSGAALAGVVSGDSVTLSTTGATGAFADKNVGTAKTVTVSGLALGGGDAANYALTQPTAAANITARTLTVNGISAANKVYDGTTTAAINTGGAALAGVISPDAVTLNTAGATGAFSDKNVGTGKTVTVSGLTLAGADAGNYAVTQPTTTATITASTLTVNGVTAASKTYDGTTSATLNTASAALAGVINGDAVTLSVSGATGTFSDKNVGAAKTVTVSGLALGGTDGPNYLLTQPVATADITARPVTASGITAANKIYDGTTTATVNMAAATLQGAVSGDTIALGTTGATAAFATKDVGNGITVTITGLTLTGADAGNYQLSSAPVTTTANITPATVTPTVTAADKQYDGTTTATIATRSLGGVIGGDDVSLAGGAAAFADPNVGSGKTVTITGLTLAGGAAGDYQLSTTTATATASITARPITVTADAKSKTYGDADPAFTYQVTGGSLVSGDSFSGSLSRVAGEPVGTYAITQGTLAVNANYALAFVGADLTITPRAVTVTADAQTKVYGAADPALTYKITSGSLASGDSFSGALTRVSGENVGTYAIQQGSVALNGNYTLAFVGADFVITPATPTVTVTGGTFTYDGTAHPAGASATGIGGAVVTGTFGLNYTPGGSAPVNAGSYSVSASFTSSDPNYTNGTGTASITVNPATPAIAVGGGPFTYDGTAHAASASATGIGGASVAGTFALTYAPGGTTAPTAAGTYAVTANFVTSDSNYANGSGSGSITINKATPTVTVTGGPFTYDGTAHPASASAAGIGGAAVAGSFSFAYLPGGNSAPVNAGTYTVTASFTSSDGNYGPATGNGSISIAKATPTVAWSNPADIVYGTALGATQLNAAAAFGGNNVAGTFAYTPPAGTMLNAGSGQTLSVTFTPNDQANYNGASKSVSINVLKATPVITWVPAPSSIVLGTPLSGAQLDATTTVAGTFAYTPAAGTVLGAGSGQMLSATFTPTDGANYNGAAKSVNINVLYSTGSCYGDAGHQILQPIDPNGLSVFKKGSTTPAKFRVCDASGNSIGNPGVVKTFNLIGIVNGTTTTTVNEVVDSTTPDAAFRWDATGQQWIFNVSTKQSPFAANQTYVFAIGLNDGTTIKFQYGLK